MRKTVLVMMLIFLSVALTFAGGTKEGNATTATGAVKIAYIPQNTGNPYFDRINLGFQNAQKELGIDVVYIGPASPDPTSQIPIIQEQVQRGINVLSIQANSVNSLNTVFDDVRKKGIFVIANNADVTGNEEHRDAAVLAVDFSTLGKYLLDAMGTLLNYKGKFAILSATPDAPAQRQWIEEPGGIKDLLKNDPKYKDMTLVEVAYGNDVPQKSVTECQALLEKYPDLNGIMAPTSVAVAAAGQVFESMGVYPGGSSGRNVILMGTGLPNETRRFVKEGAIQEDMLWDPADIGYASAYLAYGLVKKTIQLGEGKTFAAGKLGTLTFGKNNLVICGGPKTFTKDNIDSFNF